MNKSDAIALVKTIKGLFPTTTKEQGELLALKLGPYETARALAVIRTHAASHAWLEIPQLLEGLRADHERHVDLLRKTDQERIIDWLRKTKPASYSGMDDESALMCHFGECMAAVEAKQGITPYGLSFAKGKLWADCVWAFRQIGKTVAEAEDMAKTVCGDKPVLQRGIFQTA